MPISSLSVVSASQAYLYSLCPPTQPPENPHEAATSWPLLFGGEGVHRFYEAVEFLCGVGSYSEPSASRAFAGCFCGLLSGDWVCAQSLVGCGVCFAGFFILALPTHPTARKPPRSRHFVAASLRGRAVSTASTKPWDFCAVSAPTRSRPLRWLLWIAFAGCP